MELQYEVCPRRLQPEDVDRAMKSVLLFWDHTPTVEQLQAFLANDANILISAELDDVPVGQAIGYILQRWDGSDPMLFLYSIDVAEEYHRRGIGRSIINFLRETGKAHGCASTFVVTNENNTAAMHLYQSTGGKRPWEDDVLFVYEG
ncbi:MAG: GNAT family N-acetyltransferase [bacterium]